MKHYLGDSVYYEQDGRAVTLTTDNGLGPSNTIVLDGDVLAALLRQLGNDFTRTMLRALIGEP